MLKQELIEAIGEKTMKKISNLGIVGELDDIDQSEGVIMLIDDLREPYKRLGKAGLEETIETWAKRIAENEYQMKLSDVHTSIEFISWVKYTLMIKLYLKA